MSHPGGDDGVVIVSWDFCFFFLILCVSYAGGAGVLDIDQIIM